MASVAQREPIESEFVGRVLMRNSPVLTWRPALAARLRDDTGGAKDGPRDRTESSDRISRAPTRRVVAWPVVRNLVRHSRVETAWAIAVRCAGAAAVVAVLAVVAMTAPWPQGAGPARAVATRFHAIRALDEPRDVLAANAAPAPSTRVDHAARHARRPARRAQR